MVEVAVRETPWPHPNNEEEVVVVEGVVTVTIEGVIEVVMVTTGVVIVTTGVVIEVVIEVIRGGEVVVAATRMAMMTEPDPGTTHEAGVVKVMISDPQPRKWRDDPN